MSILALSLPVLTALFFHLGFLLLSLFSVAFRREFSKVPMGLRSRGRKKHSVLCTKDLPNIEAYIETLTSGAKRNIKKADAELAKHNVFMTSRQNTPLHACRALPAYMSVILSHEQRAWGHWVKATLDSIVRWVTPQLRLSRRFRILLICTSVGKQESSYVKIAAPVVIFSDGFVTRNL